MTEERATYQAAGESSPERPFEIDDTNLYDILAQMSPSVWDAHGDDYLNVYGEYSLADLVVEWIYDCLSRPEAPAFDYDDLDVPEVVEYLESVMPVYIVGLIAVVDSCDRLARAKEES